MVIINEKYQVISDGTQFILQKLVEACRSREKRHQGEIHQERQCWLLSKPRDGFKGVFT